MNTNENFKYDLNSDTEGLDPTPAMLPSFCETWPPLHSPNTFLNANNISKQLNLMDLDIGENDLSISNNYIPPIKTSRGQGV